MQPCRRQRRATFPLQLGGVLKDWVESSDLDGYRAADPRQIVDAALTADIERYALPEQVREDYLSAYEGDRFVESMKYVRAYPRELPVLRDLLPAIETPVQIIAGARDSAVPPVNAEFLHERLPKSKLDVIDVGHFVWEDGAGEYAALVTSWWRGGYAKTGERETGVPGMSGLATQPLARAASSRSGETSRSCAWATAPCRFRGPVSGASRATATR